MNVSQSSGFDDMTALQGLLDRGPSWSVGTADLPVGFGVQRSIPDHSSQHGGKCNGQSCLPSHDAPNFVVTPESSPCPCDRWCESSGSCLIDGALLGSAPPQTDFQSQRNVHFAPQIEVFEYVENDGIANYTVRNQLLVSHAPLEAAKDVVASQPVWPGEADYQPAAFWDFWHQSWFLHGFSSGIEGLEEYGSDSVCSPLEPVMPHLQCRPETNPPPVLIAHPVRNANDFDIDLDEEPDHGNDIGVTFFRWQDIAEVVDLLPLSFANGIPFITYGLRNVPLGRRDFASPDLSPTRIREIIWQLWQDEVYQFEDISIHFVRPQPTAELACHGVIVLIVEIINDEMPEGVSPVLALTCDCNDRLLDTPQAIYVPQATDKAELTAHFGMSHLCAPNGFRQCKVYVANFLVNAGQIPVAPGVLVKLVISAKLRIFARAIDWFPDIERFAAMVRRNVRSGSQVHGLELHLPYRASTTLQFRIADIFQPQVLCTQVAQSSGYDPPVVFPLAGDILGLANPMLGSHFSAMVLPGDVPMDLAFATVTQLVDQDGTVQCSCNQVVRRDDYPDLLGLHRYLCGQFQLDPTFDFRFGCNGQVLDTIQAVSFASVVVHTVQQNAPDGPQGHTDLSDSAMSALYEPSDDSVCTDSLSLLQTQAVRGRSLLLMQHAQPSYKIEVSPAVEDVERCDIALAMPSHFASPRGWLDRRTYNLTGLSHGIEILVDPWRSHGSVDILCECLYLVDDELVPQCLFVLRVPGISTCGDILAELAKQSPVSLSEVDSICIDGCPVFQDSKTTIVDGAHCVVTLDDPLSDGFGAFHTIEFQSHAMMSNVVTTYIHDAPQEPRRLDVVGPHVPEQFLAPLLSGSLVQQPLGLHQVKWDPNDLEPCRALFLVDVASPGDGHDPMLFVLQQPDGQQAWQICHLKPIPVYLQTLPAGFLLLHSFALSWMDGMLTLSMSVLLRALVSSVTQLSVFLLKLISHLLMECNYSSLGSLRHGLQLCLMVR